jgi:RNA-splicing ligase RtcB
MVDLREPLESLITPPARFTEATGFPRAHEIRLYDTTLRDGEQTPGRNLAWLEDGTADFREYVRWLGWAQDYARANRDAMLKAIVAVLQRRFPDLSLTAEAVNCHHNYASVEEHFGHRVWVTRKGAVRTSVRAEHLPDSLRDIRLAIEDAVPVGFDMHKETPMGVSKIWRKRFAADYKDMIARFPQIEQKDATAAPRQLGTLGGGNHFIELCLDESRRRLGDAALGLARHRQ